MAKTTTALKVVSADPGWGTGVVTYTLANAAQPAEGAPAEQLYVNVQFPLEDATKAQAKARAKEILQAALAALD